MIRKIWILKSKFMSKWFSKRVIQINSVWLILSRKSLRNIIHSKQAKFYLNSVKTVFIHIAFEKLIYLLIGSYKALFGQFTITEVWFVTYRSCVI